MCCSIHDPWMQKGRNGWSNHQSKIMVKCWLWMLMDGWLCFSRYSLHNCDQCCKCINLWQTLTSIMPIFPSVFFSYSSTKAFIWSVNSCVERERGKWKRGRMSTRCRSRAYHAVAAACFESCLKGIHRLVGHLRVYCHLSHASLNYAHRGKLRLQPSGQWRWETSSAPLN